MFVRMGLFRIALLLSGDGLSLFQLSGRRMMFVSDKPVTADFPQTDGEAALGLLFAADSEERVAESDRIAGGDF